MSDTIIATSNLTMFYGKYPGILEIDLSVRKGEVFGFLGPNGAGKTTTQRILLDIIHATAGRATIFGLDSRREGPAIRKRVGYLPGEFSAYPNLRAQEFLDLLASLQVRRVDPAYRRELYDRLALDPSRKIKQYSHGTRQKIAIVAAFMARPELLILDEPTIGLDPLVQQTVLELVREARAEGRTVFFSSHILSEVQAVCDRVGIIRDGQLICTESVETLTRRQFKRVRLTLQELPPPDLFHLKGITETGRDGKQVTLEVRQGLEQLMQKAASFGIEDIEVPPVTLEEIFLAFYERPNAGGKHD